VSERSPETAKSVKYLKTMSGNLQYFPISQFKPVPRPEQFAHITDIGNYCILVPNYACKTSALQARKLREFFIVEGYGNRSRSIARLVGNSNKVGSYRVRGQRKLWRIYMK